MRCPYCKDPMEEGCVQGPRGIYWSEKPSKFIPPYKKNTMPLSEETFLTIPTIRAHRCQKCEIIILCSKEKQVYW
ncbi:PF20097 family protein [Oscillibacter valericigenes]|uniref:PF20097 family protein n=1 Tax=Oscillibacter valericigenes TaxID=351091 RepID=UPI0038B3793A